MGDYVLSEEKILPELEEEVKEEKKSFWDEEFKIDLEEDSSNWEKAVDKLCEIGEVYPITKEELEEIYKINYMNDWEVDKDYIESYKEWDEEVAYNLGLVTKDGVVVGVR